MHPDIPDLNIGHLFFYFAPEMHLHNDYIACRNYRRVETQRFRSQSNKAKVRAFAAKVSGGSLEAIQNWKMRKQRYLFPLSTVYRNNLSEVQATAKQR